MKILGMLFGALGLIVLFLIIGLFFIKFGWSLFVVPVFHLPELTWMQAFGFSLLASTFRSTSSKSSS
jgi:hypothetical protein